MSKINYFEFSDAWVFMALSNYELEWKKIELTNIIARGDMLNHAIFTLEELSNGFQKLQVKGLIKIKEDQIALSNLGLGIMKKVVDSKSGLFTMVDYALKRINTEKIYIENISGNLISSCEFLTENNLSKAYKIYSK
ncbi:hypothetical protein JBL43_15995 [Aureibaculum sp. A20]|uniref:Thioesterase n=1 Tax=Aureibaculum flavum TaxID=2795986 RepID=A0ABS0WUT3_9FLAO|nr:hypothetical protein [Aureibaculum flavum]MBJ2175756.1 hypothetical protein [Aureibaculum flavum]